MVAFGGGLHFASELPENSKLLGGTIPNIVYNVTWVNDAAGE
jgi:hypothetical protein